MSHPLDPGVVLYNLTVPAFAGATGWGMRGGYTYIMTNKPFGVLYIGVTADIIARVLAHREGRGSKFVTKWGCTRLVLIEPHDTIQDAITREKALKNWNRAWKLQLIVEMNPVWNDLWETING